MPGKVGPLVPTQFQADLINSESSDFHVLAVLPSFSSQGPFSDNLPSQQVP